MKILIIIFVVLLVAAGVYFFMRSGEETVSSPNPSVGSTQSQETVSGSPEISSTSTPGASISLSPTPSGSAGSSGGSSEGSVKTITVTGMDFSLLPNEIRVKQGDAVKITFKNNEGFHDFHIDAFNVATPRINSRQSATVEFIADKKGTFEYYCGVGTHKQLGMTGNLIVE